MMTLSEIQREIAVLPELRLTEEPVKTAEVTPLTVVTRQGRLLLRLTALIETLTAQTKELTIQVQSDQQEREHFIELAAQWQQDQRVKRQEVADRLKEFAHEVIYLIDILDWVVDSLKSRQLPLADDVVRARQDGVRRLAALGITEVTASGVMDGRLHEGVDVVSSETVPPYHIVSIVRPGWQWGETILRRSTVITAAPPQTTDNGAQLDGIEQIYDWEERGKEREPEQGAEQSKSRRRRSRAVPDNRD